LKRFFYILPFSLFLICSVFFSCEKYEHKNPEYQCELCAFGDSLEGTYRGVASGFDVYPSSDPNVNPTNGYVDSLTITVTRFYENLSDFADSTYLTFQINLQFDMGSSKNGIVKIVDRDGKDQNNVYSSMYTIANQGYVILQPDQIDFMARGVNNSPNNPAGPINIVRMQSILYKQ